MCKVKDCDCAEEYEKLLRRIVDYVKKRSGFANG